MKLYLSLAASCLAYALAGCAPRADSGTPAAEAGSAAGAHRDGASLFDGSCAACHQRDGKGIAGAYPSLAGSPLVLGDPAPLAAWVVEGRRPPQWPADRYSTVMPKFGWMSDADAAAVLTHVRSHFGNSAPPVDTAAVAGALGHLSHE